MDKIVVGPITKPAYACMYIVAWLGRFTVKIICPTDDAEFKMAYSFYMT